MTITINGRNDKPDVAADTNSVTANESETANNAGTFYDVDLSDKVKITASVGVITQDTGNSGAWSWSLLTSDGPDENQTVIITATDEAGGQQTTTFDLTVVNIAPTITIGGAAEVIEGLPYILKLGAITDPGPDTVSTGCNRSGIRGRTPQNGCISRVWQHHYRN